MQFGYGVLLLWNVPWVPAGHYIIWNLTDGFLQPVQYVEVTSLTSDVITAEEMKEQTEKQSPQTVITSHFGGTENKGIELKENIKYYTTMDGRCLCNKSFTLYRFQLIKVWDMTHGVVLLRGPDTLNLSSQKFFMICEKCCQTDDMSRVAAERAASESTCKTTICI